MKNAIVTGGTRGIGLAIASMLLEEGYFVTVTYAHDDESADRCRQEFSAFPDRFEIVKADNADKMQMSAFTAKMRQKGHIDCLVCNAGTTLRKNLPDISDDEWESVLHVNLSSKVFLVRDLIPVIPDGSRIVFIASMMGIYPHSTSLAYGVSKAAIIALAENMVKLFEGTGTTVNAVAPGFVDTDWQKDKEEGHSRRICEKIALGRFAEPKEIAEAVRFCVRNAYVNGSVIQVSGGYSYK